MSRVRPLTPRVVRLSRAFFLTIAGIIAIAGVSFVVMGLVEWDRAARSSEWPQVQGEVLESEVSTSSHRTKGGGRSRSYSASVKFRYTVEGTAHEGQRITFRTTIGGGEGAARKRAAEYPIGSSVAVWYDPNAPDLAVLEPGADWTNAIPVAIGLFSVAFCCLVIWLVLRITRRMMALVAPTPSPAEPRRWFPPGTRED